MAKRDLDTWCKGKVGVPHEPQLTTDTPLGRLGQCGVAPGTKSSWVCVHSEVCSVCGRFLTRSWQMKKEQCPVYMTKKS